MDRRGDRVIDPALRDALAAFDDAALATNPGRVLRNAELDLARYRTLEAKELTADLELDARGAVTTSLTYCKLAMKGCRLPSMRARPTFDEILNRDTIPSWL